MHPSHVAYVTFTIPERTSESVLEFDQLCSPRHTYDHTRTMDDVDVFAAMGIAGFGKAKKKAKAPVNVKDFEKNKRQPEVSDIITSDFHSINGMHDRKVP